LNNSVAVTERSNGLGSKAIQENQDSKSRKWSTVDGRGCLATDLDGIEGRVKEPNQEGENNVEYVVFQI
jgi:hypothetical protein